MKYILEKLGLENVKEIKINKFDSDSCDSIISHCIAKLPYVRVLSLSNISPKINKAIIEHLKPLKCLESLSIAKCDYSKDIYSAAKTVFKRLKVLGIKDDCELTNQYIVLYMNDA